MIRYEEIVQQIFFSFVNVPTKNSIYLLQKMPSIKRPILIYVTKAVSSCENLPWSNQCATTETTVSYRRPLLLERDLELIQDLNELSTVQCDIPYQVSDSRGWVSHGFSYLHRAFLFNFSLKPKNSPINTLLSNSV